MNDIPNDASRIGTPFFSAASQKIPFLLSEIAGAFGDFGTIIPLILTAAVVCHLPLSPILLFFGIWFVATGIIYRLPLPIEPMKAVAAVAIAEQMGAGEIAAAGLILGLIFLLLSSERIMGFLGRVIPEAVLRGIQVGLALLLAKTALGYITGDFPVFALAFAIILIGLFVSWRRWFPDISAIVVVLVGVSIGILINGFPGFQLSGLPPLVIPTPGDMTGALTDLVPAQVILTITNAILATSLLAKDLFREEVPPKKLSRVIGVMNLTSAPFGGFPMCHGSNGLAGQYRFGARTGLASIIAGIVFLVLALFFASQAILTLIPVGIFGALLLFTAFELGKHGLRRESWAIAGIMGVVTLASSLTLAFIVGMVVVYGVSWYNARRKRPGHASV